MSHRTPGREQRLRAAIETPPLLRESPYRQGDIPRFQLSEWESQFGWAAGITGVGQDGTFDLGLASAGSASDVMGRWLRFQKAFEPQFRQVAVSRQVHETSIRRHEKLTDGWLILDGFDGHMTTQRGLLLAVSVADCIPIYLAAPKQGAVALLHAGWRGVAGGILERGIQELGNLSAARPGDLVAHFGVGICGDCYEVGPETLEALGAPSGRTADLRGLLAARAQDCGLRQITASPWCSRHHTDFHSHRRDQTGAGRMVAYLGMPLT